MAAPEMERVEAVGAQDCPQSLKLAEDPDFPENEDWNDVSKLLEEQGGGRSVFQDFQVADCTPEFHFWLSGLLSGDGNDEPWPKLPDGPESTVGTVSLVSCPCDLSRARALRSVGFGDLKEKAKAITIAKKWRQWDVLQIS